jgi:L,D-peptidoglycan transpeptidase YkuD (ErfK/YbiS/YcfS/YnhG family)
VKPLVCLAASASVLLLAAPSGDATGSKGTSAGCAQQVVVTGQLSSSVATLRLTACGRTVAGPWPAHVGWNGLSRSRREGDGTTPIGTFRFGDTIYGSAPDPGVHLRYHRIVCGDYWVEDPRSPSYNTFRHVACGTSPPFRAADGLWQSPRAYRHLAFIGYNADPVVPGRGSAIFLHASTGGPTNGCVSLSVPRLVQTLRWLRPGATITIKVM